jgi:hypothetical protein
MKTIPEGLNMINAVAGDIAGEKKDVLAALIDNCKSKWEPELAKIVQAESDAAEDERLIAERKLAREEARKNPTTSTSGDLDAPAPVVTPPETKAAQNKNKAKAAEEIV